MGDSVRPEARQCAARDQVGSREFHHAADGSFGDSIQLMNVRRARCGVHTFSREQLGELLREELSSVIAVQCAYHAGRRVLAAVQ
eukprot:3453038-Pleurochrysis_carterae.AAC.1